MADYMELLGALDKGGIDWGSPDEIPELHEPTPLASDSNKPDYKAILNSIAGFSHDEQGKAKDDTADIPIQYAAPGNAPRLASFAPPPMAAASPGWPYGR